MREMNVKRNEFGMRMLNNRFASIINDVHSKWKPMKKSRKKTHIYNRICEDWMQLRISRYDSMVSASLAWRSSAKEQAIISFNSSQIHVSAEGRKRFRTHLIYGWYFSMFTIKSKMYHFYYSSHTWIQFIQRFRCFPSFYVRCIDANKSNWAWD